MKRCKLSGGKRKYHSKLAAMLDNQDMPIIARAYLCRYCKMWHLTRRPAS